MGKVQNIGEKLNKSPLYLELLAIGSEEQSIEPEALREYVHLLNCNEVRSRAGQSSDRDVLAKHASTALKQLVSRFATQTTKYLVVNIALGIQKGYEGLSITEREGKLETEASITSRMFKYYRQMTFESMVESLNCQASHTVGDQTAKAPSDPTVPELAFMRRISAPADPSVQPFMLLGSAAADLHFAVLAGDFSHHFNKEIGPPYASGEREGIPLVGNQLTIFSECAFNASVRFARRAIELPTTPPKQIIQTQTLEEIHFLIETVNLCSPLSSFLAKGELQAEDIDLGSDEEVSAGGLSKESLWAFSLFWEHWTPWYNRHYRAYATPTPLEAMCAKAGALMLLIGRHVGYSRPVFVEARRMALEMLTRYYDDADAYQPLLRGSSLMAHADSYFDNRSLPLAVSEVVWHN